MKNGEEDICEGEIHQRWFELAGKLPAVNHYHPPSVIFIDQFVVFINHPSLPCANPHYYTSISECTPIPC